MEQEQTPVTSETGGVPASGSKNNTKLIVVIVGLVALGILGMMANSRFTGERMVERAMERATGGDVDFDMSTDGEGTIRVTGEDGAEMEYSTGGNVKLPSDWPSDMPVMDDANITYVGTMNPQTGEPGAVVMFLTSKSVSAVGEYYTQALGDAGWVIASTMTVAEATIFTATKDERESGIYIAGGDEGTSVTISISQ